jgi:predicted nuclease of restriction endonuclease-like (RecB) superfamily
MMKVYIFIEAGARENQLSKGLRRVSRSEKNSVKSLFSSKNLQEKHFFHGNTTMIAWDSNQVFRLVPTVLHLSAAKSEDFEKNDESLDAGNLALQLKKIYYKTF